MNTFKLEEYLTQYEFSAPYLICCSDPESWQMSEIIALADQDAQPLWNELPLSYTEPYGHPLLREQIAHSLYPNLSAENILCFAGAEEGIFATLSVLCDDDSHAIILTPCYQSLLEIPLAQGCEVSQIELKEENQWRIDLNAIEQAIQPNTRCIIINFPHNPTGQVLSQEEAGELIQLCEKHGIWLFADEVYRLLGAPEKKWATPIACQYERAFSLGVMSKAFGMAGLRVGWIACQDQAILHKIKKFKDYLSICNSAPAEIISLIALQNKDYILARNNEIVAKNLSLLDQFLANYTERFSWVRSQGGCVGFIHYKHTESVDRFCQRLVDSKGVLLMPASIYDYNSNHFRIGFGRKNMPEALNKLKEFIDENL